MDVKARKSLLSTCEMFLKIQGVGVEDMVEKIVSALKRYACILFDGYKTY